MGLSRFFRRWASVPEWAKFFNKAQYCRFIELVDADFTRRGHSAHIQDGVVTVEEGESSFGLLNLAQICKQLPPDDWVDAIASHFATIDQSEAEREELEQEVDHYEQVEDRLGLRLYHEDYLDNEAVSSAIVYRDIPGIASVLVIDMPTSIATVPQDQLALWERDPERLRDRALLNLAELAACSSELVEVEPGCTIDVLLGDSLFTATWALRLEERLPACGGEHGALIGIPHRHALISHPITSQAVLSAINTMIPMIIGMYQEGPGSISPKLYWYRDGVYHDLPFEIGEQEINFTPPQEFLQMVEDLLD